MQIMLIALLLLAHPEDGLVIECSGWGCGITLNGVTVDCWGDDCILVIGPDSIIVKRKRTIAQYWDSENIECLTGPMGVPPFTTGVVPEPWSKQEWAAWKHGLGLPARCQPFDGDRDRDFDLADLAYLQTEFMR